MTDYRLIARSPCRITLNNKVKTVKANDSFIANEQEKDRLMRGMYRKKLVVVGKVEKPETSYEQTTFKESKELETSQTEESEESKESEDLHKGEVLDADETFENRLERKGLPSPSIPLNTHWATVKSKVQDLEQQVPIPLDLIRAIREKFPNYSAVVEECDRILEENEE